MVHPFESRRLTGQPLGSFETGSNSTQACCDRVASASALRTMSKMIPIIVRASRSPPAANSPAPVLGGDLPADAR